MRKADQKKGYNMTAYYVLGSVILVLSGTAMFFFTVTRGALILRGLRPGSESPTDHVYPIYSNMRLIKMIDFQPIISAILLFQYKRLVSTIVDKLVRTRLDDEEVLITSCAFGNVIPRVVNASVQAGARKVSIVDVIKNELDHAEQKLLEHSDRIEMLTQNAASLEIESGSISANVIFFLLHELPHHLKVQALEESARVLKPGGTLYLAEFHRPEPWLLRAFSWTYFKVFEPLGLALWNSHDPIKMLNDIGGFSCERRTFFFGNFQVIVATKEK